MNPTNKQIKQYLLQWLESLDGDGLIIVDSDLIDAQLKQAEKVDFKSLRGMFGQPIYDSVKDWAEDGW